MRLADVSTPAGAGFVLMGMAFAGGVHLYLGMAISAFGFLLIALSR